MNEHEENILKEIDIILQERKSYPKAYINKDHKIFDFLSLIFMGLGFVSLILIYFTNITLIQATCFFIISYILKPSDTDRYKFFIKSISEDLGNIRANTAVMVKHKK